MLRFPRRLSLVAVLLLIAPGISPADDDPAEREQVRRWFKFYAQEAAAIEVKPAGENAAPLKLIEEPLMTWSNPIRSGQQHGGLYLWTEDGRPMLIGSLWSAVDREDSSMRYIAREWHSLAQKNVQARRDGKLLWSSGGPGIQWQRLADDEPPRVSAPLRLVQMRRILRVLRGQIVGSDDENENELRLLPQPLYRYPAGVAGAIDGAIFTLAMGTDPELFLLLEARRTDDGPQWFLAVARFTHVPAVLKRGDKTLWSCEKAKPYQDTGAYHLYWRAGHRKAVIGEDELD